ncbi:Pr6Pr family membrane protein [Nocardioides dubius]|uniref:Pr6Pr family membrane protein n=1 Tax=Nocardioides dubius TaxID=317019 RepID=A0ABN1TTB4_9ACTN
MPLATNHQSTRLAWAIVRLATSAAIVAAFWVTLSASVDSWDDAGYADKGTLWVNFFSYFTILSNIAAAVLLLVGAVRLLTTGPRPEPGWLSGTRAAVATYMGITGLVYNLLLRGLEVTGGGDVAAWTNEVMHVIGPVVVVADWLFAPDRRPLAWRQVATILIFPITWAAYTLIRGPRVTDQIKDHDSWYPYPFLNPDNGGYLAVAGWVVVIALAFGIVAALLVSASRRN